MALTRPTRRTALGMLAAGIRPQLWAANSMEPAELNIGGATVSVSFGSGNTELPRSAIIRWITQAAQAVTVYYGRFPLPNARIRVTPEDGRSGVFNGTTYGQDGGFTRISVGRQTTQDQLDKDWTMTHEMIHYAFPDMARQHHWIEEGTATYVEPIARAQAGQLDPARVWADLARDMPKGEPAENDRGLDNTHTWGRTYWGGALFCMVADVRIREATDNRKGLQNALRGILAAGGNIEVHWPITKAFQAGDQATGVTVLTDLYNQMKDAPVNIDLNKMWRQLGIEAHGHSASFNDQAPSAAIRKAITSPA